MTDINDPEQARLLKNNHELLDKIEKLKRELEQTRENSYSERAELSISKALVSQYETMLLENIKLIASLRAEIEKLSCWLEQAEQR